MSEVKTHDRRINLQADIKATMQALEGYVRSGGYRRAAQLANDLSRKLDMLAEMTSATEPRVRFQEVTPEQAAHAERRDEQRKRHRVPRPSPRFEVKELP